MLPSVSNANALASIQSSPQGNNTQAITAKLNLLETKLNSIDPNKTTYEINAFKEFIDHNKNKMLDAPAISDKLITSLRLVNEINDNIEMGENNVENLNQLNKVMGEMDSILNPDNSGHQCVEDRIKNEITRSAEKVTKEAQRVSERVTNELERNVNKVANEANRVKEKIKKFRF